MNLSRVLLLSMLFLSAMGQLPSQDIMALLEFKKGIKHDPTGFVLNSWNDESIDFNGCPSSWNGIVCNGGNVAGVVLDNLGLSADADFSMFSNLTMLVKLSMANNSISGVLPNNLGNFKSLQFLDLSDNLFSSSLPEEIGRSISLKNLSLAGNNFSGEIPESMGRLISLQSLDISRNSLSGLLPKSLTRLNNLLYLNLSSNGFIGKFPRGFELISSLQVLDLHGNSIDGNLDGEFFLLTNASYVDFSGNRLVTTSGKLLPGISESIKHLNLSHNQLEGSLTSGLQLFQNLKVLDLSYNQLSGELPGFNYVYDLQVLKLNNNRFSGSLPNNLLKGDSLLLTTLDLSGNNLSGPISAIMSTTLHSLDLSSNSLTGELPLLTGSCVLLDLSNNQFEGNLTRWSKWENIEYLDLSQNHFTGSFPDVTPQLLRANHLNLSYNKLTGSLPERIPTHYPKLRVLDISSNSLEGPIPSALLSMSTLEEIHLQNNGMTGNIGPLPSSGSRIRLLDLSHNRFDGDLPGVFGSLTNLQVLNLAANNLFGSLPNSMNDLVSLSSLDVSQNYFTGPLPSNLSSSIMAFNVSYNDLSGTVPENLRNFPPPSFYPGNSKLLLPAGSPGSSASEVSKRKPKNLLIKIVIIVSCAIALIILILVAIILFCICKSRRREERSITGKEITRQAQTIPSGSGGGMVVSAEDLVASRKGSSSEILSPDEKLAVATGFSPSKTSNLSWSPGSGDSFPPDQQLARLDVRSPDRLVGELQFLDDSIRLTPEELSRAPAEVLGRSSHGTSYRATLDNGIFLTVKWLREGVAKQRKEFAKEVKKFANIRHPNVVTLRGYYWGPTQHEKLILSDYISPGSLASFLYDRPGRKGPPLAWIQRLKIAVDVARGLNYLHFDRAVPHGNLKATNILLDGAELNARVADYCLHRLMTQAGTVEQILDAGILGYRAPELAASRKPLPSFKSDVYAFGVILLEILTGRCAGDVITGEQEGVDLTDWVRLRVAEGHGAECFDSVLTQEMGSDPVTEKGTKEVLGIALKCIRSVSERPGIKTIYEDLSSI
ncbi:probable LRR receptor-like serine/threonine-protein kinase At4g20940 [Eutrema salsugineum]|uniref:probable LRR receptor-like serine/threonine-protein kinase At4g20940 n=1 Tax=Eutrema salsugineum TaxID=72664 RepID=UPI000CED3F3B|nr:probable LRR receptor-like serine/threonine-protein kinase At4g20940 [Eutrema salsugineum]XP_024005136.1 probable LRR receptor-like serine/threonine-protein kinase At4g20940 [Eutrema salsugineum]XP_024005137.1 probable LRR receptor-like serine/threonine-protein kinase At4g20940 [Eutrema salsugineum]XP_024005138.1 probable LRR receptor-like serine/threonine-protein kinase At4g20940 [Eutrema salsugineum]